MSLPERGAPRPTSLPSSIGRRSFCRRRNALPDRRPRGQPRPAQRTRSRFGPARTLHQRRKIWCAFGPRRPHHHHVAYRAFSNRRRPARASMGRTRRTSGDTYRAKRVWHALGRKQPGRRTRCRCADRLSFRRCRVHDAGTTAALAAGHLAHGSAVVNVTLHWTTRKRGEPKARPCLRRQ